MVEDKKEAKSSDFESKLEAFKQANKTSKVLGHELGVMSLQHFEKCGDTTYLQRLYDSMIGNWNRRNALVKWACDFAPIKFSDSSFVKDKNKAETSEDGSGAILNVQMEAALKQSWFDYAKETAIKNYNAQDVFKALQGTLKRFDNVETHKPTTDKAAQVVGLIRSKLVEMQDAA